MAAQETDHSELGAGWIKRIVVAADGSPASRRGLDEVADLARRLGAEVAVVHIRHMPASALMGSGVPVQQLLDGLDETEATVREQAIQVLGGAGVPWDFVVREGRPGDEIVKVIEETDADLVVVGSNRHSSLHNLVLGSTAAYLAGHSPAPVLVMRAKAARGAAALAGEAAR